MSDVRERSNRGDSVEATRMQPGNLPVDPRLFSTTATRKLAKLHTRRARDPVSPFPAANGLLSTSPSSSYTTPMVNWLVPVGFGVSVRCSPVSLEERLRGTPRRPHVVHVSQNPPPARISPPRLCVHLRFWIARNVFTNVHDAKTLIMSRSRSKSKRSISLTIQVRKGPQRAARSPRGSTRDCWDHGRQ
jgi:hypothetical protein